MKELRMRAFIGLLGLAGAGFLVSSVTTSVGCSEGGSTTGAAGAGNTAGAAGASGTAGTTGGGGSGGSGGGGGASAALGCATSALPPNPPAPVIADFAAAAIPIGGTFMYGTPAPVLAVENGGLHVTLNAPGMATAQYLGFGIYFNGDVAGMMCIDATAYTGIKFDISGTIAGCSMQYSTNDSAHSNHANDMKGSGGDGVYPPQATLPALTATPATISMPFTGAGAPSNGNPALDIVKEKLTGAQWQFSVPAAATAPCAADIVIDNVSFY